MLRRFLWLAAVVVLLALAATVFLIVRQPSSPVEAARSTLLGTPFRIELTLAVDIPKGSESDNPDHQEIDATGVVDLAAGTGEMTYDFNELNNSAGFLGHFDSMDMILTDDSIYIDVFVDGPAWLRIVPEDIGTGDVARLHDMLLTNPLTLPAYLEVEAIDHQASDTEIRRTVSPESLASADDAFAAAVGATFEEWDVEAIDVTVTLGGAVPEEVVLSFSYAPGGVGKAIDVTATYELSPQDASPDVVLPADDDVREYADIFGGT